MIFFSYRGCWMWSSNCGSLLQIILVVFIGGCLFAHKCFKTITHQLLLLPLLTIIAHFPTFKTSPTYPAQKFRGSSLWGQWFRLSLFALCCRGCAFGSLKTALIFSICEFGYCMHDPRSFVVAPQSSIGILWQIWWNSKRKVYFNTVLLM